MRQHQFGTLWPVSTLTLGGGGLGMVWGETTFDECVATVRAAVEAGINLLDLAPRYGDGKAEEVVGAAFDGKLPEGVASPASAISASRPRARSSPFCAARSREACAGCASIGSICSSCIRMLCPIRTTGAAGPTPRRA